MTRIYIINLPLENYLSRSYIKGIKSHNILLLILLIKDINKIYLQIVITIFLPESFNTNIKYQFLKSLL